MYIQTNSLWGCLVMMYTTSSTKDHGGGCTHYSLVTDAGGYTSYSSSTNVTQSLTYVDLREKEVGTKHNLIRSIELAGLGTQFIGVATAYENFHTVFAYTWLCRLCNYKFNKIYSAAYTGAYDVVLRHYFKKHPEHISLLILSGDC